MAKIASIRGLSLAVNMQKRTELVAPCTAVVAVSRNTRDFPGSGRKKTRIAVPATSVTAIHPAPWAVTVVEGSPASRLARAA